MRKGGRSLKTFKPYKSENQTLKISNSFSLLNLYLAGRSVSRTIIRIQRHLKNIWDLMHPHVHIVQVWSSGNCPVKLSPSQYGRAPWLHPVCGARRMWVWENISPGYSSLVCGHRSEFLPQSLCKFWRRTNGIWDMRELWRVMMAQCIHQGSGIMELLPRKQDISKKNDHSEMLWCPQKSDQSWNRNGSRYSELLLICVTKMRNHLAIKMSSYFWINWPIWEKSTFLEIQDVSWKRPTRFSVHLARWTPSKEFYS
jgi:hypothetical protein